MINSPNTVLDLLIFNESIVDERDTYILVIEWANGGSLRNYLKSNFLCMTGDDKLCFAKDITKGIMCLHKKGIIHRDLVIQVICYEDFLTYSKGYL